MLTRLQISGRILFREERRREMRICTVRITLGGEGETELRIHDEIVRRYNESIKLGKGKMLPGQQGECCQS
jgi:hypothetical protein